MWESGLWLYYILYRNTHFVHESENSKVKAGTGEDQTGWKRRGGRKESRYGCRDWESMGEEMCRKQGAGAVTEEGGSTGLEPPYDSRWGDEEEWEMGVENLTERERETESYEKRYEFRPWEKWKVGKISRGTDTGLLEEARWSQTKRGERMLFVPQLLTRLKWWLYYHLTGDLDTHTHFLKGVDMKMFYFRGQTPAM